MDRVPVYILAGGQSSRFGSDKARAVFEGEALIVRVQRMLEAHTSDITVVADRADKYADLHLRTIADHNPGLGPLAGLQAALNDLPDDHRWLLLCPCDAVVIEPGWIRQLLGARDEKTDAVAFLDRQNRWQPMPALYASSALPRVDQGLSAGRLSMQHLLGGLNTIPLPLPPDWPADWQANRPADLEAHRKRGQTGFDYEVDA